MPQPAVLAFGPVQCPSQAPRVYSYTRFSTPEQAQGDSRRRQADGAIRWTERKNGERASAGLSPLILDEALRLNDLGVSAFRGANTEGDRGLGGFLFACRAGLIEDGSYLLVESLDRVSRMTPRRVSRLLDDIVDAGVTIVTLGDGQEYDAARMDGDPTALLIALMVSWRAHEESKVKGQRVAAAWAEKRRRVREGIDPLLTRKGPQWLQWTGDKWEERAPHADTVRKIYQMALEGTGELRTASTLNSRGVPVMGRGSMWHRSTVAKILRSPAVIGTLVPGRMEFGTGKRVRRLEPAIEGVYPPVVTMAQWLGVRAMKSGAPAARGRSAQRPLSNIFAGLARCPECGAAMTRVNKGAVAKAGKPKLVCIRAKVGAAAHPYRSICHHLLQTAFLDQWQALLCDVPSGQSFVDGEYANLTAVIAAAEDDLDRLSEACFRAPSQTLASRVRAIEAQLVSLRADLSALDDARGAADHGLVRARIEVLAAALEGDEEGEARDLDIARVNGALRSLFSAITVDHREGVLRFQWQQGGKTEIRFAWPSIHEA